MLDELYLTKKKKSFVTNLHFLQLLRRVLRCCFAVRIMTEVSFSGKLSFFNPDP